MDEASSAIRRSPIRGLSTTVVKMLLVNPPINVPRITYKPTFLSHVRRWVKAFSSS